MEDHRKRNFDDSQRNHGISFRDTVAEEPPRALYLHVPFCVSKCAYCDFYSQSASDEVLARYHSAVCRELERLAIRDLPPLDTIYFGGGTPTLLSAQQLEELCGAVGGCLAEGGEFSVEANPATLDAAKISAMVGAGVNRVTLGAQSFSSPELALLGRIHTPYDVSESVGLLRRGGIENIGLDLIYAIPGQSLASWERSLHAATELGIEHLSCYALSFETGTPLGERLGAGELAEVDDELQRTMFERTGVVLSAAGLAQYEISNYARPGRESRHNLVYWHNRPYAAIGPAAAGYVGGRRWTNRPDLAAWLAAVEAGHQPPCEAETLTGALAMAETVMLGLRLVEGIDCDAFAARYGRALEEVFPRSLERHTRAGTVLRTQGKIRLAPEAMFISDSIFADYIDEAIG